MYESTEALERCADELRTFVRNRYFYGKLLDVQHFESEQGYFNQKRWLLNRMISGYGVVCGLNVVLTDEGKKVCVEPGLALDPAGREIVVPVRSKPLALPELPPAPSSGENEKEECDDDVDFQVGIRWHECAGDPELVRVGSACEGEAAPCAPGSVRERYEIFLREGKAPKIDWSCHIVDLVAGNRLSYDSMAHYVTEHCAKIPKDPHIPLANLGRKRDGSGTTVDITIRPIVYTNDLLFQLLIGALTPTQGRSRGGKY